MGTRGGAIGIPGLVPLVPQGGRCGGGGPSVRALPSWLSKNQDIAESRKDSVGYPHRFWDGQYLDFIYIADLHAPDALFLKRHRGGEAGGSASSQAGRLNFSKASSLKASSCTPSLISTCSLGKSEVTAVS